MGEIDASNAHMFVFVMCVLLHLPFTEIVRSDMHVFPTM
jgi:hypothetical protein